MSILIILIILIGLYYIFLHIHDEPKNFIEYDEEIILEEPKKCKIILEEPKKEIKKDDIIDDYEIYALSCS